MILPTHICGVVVTHFAANWMQIHPRFMEKHIMYQANEYIGRLQYNTLNWWHVMHARSVENRHNSMPLPNNYRS